MSTRSKTLIMEDEHRQPLVVLMHGDREVSTRNLARHLGVKTIAPCAPAVADRHSGYQVGGTSPFGTRRAMPIVMQVSIASLPYLYVNGGRRGLLVGMTPAELTGLPSCCALRYSRLGLPGALMRALDPALAEIATGKAD